MEEIRVHKDPICGMDVEETPDAIKYEHKGVTYYFCSPGCKRSFEKNPEKVLNDGPKGHM